MALSKNNWTEKEITVALYEYCRNPFGQFSASKKFVQNIGNLLGRSPSAVVYKVGNLASFDPQMKARGVVGLCHTARTDEIVWKRYFGHWDQLVCDAECIIAELKRNANVDEYGYDTATSHAEDETPSQIKSKYWKNDEFFKKMVFASYDHQCCISGVKDDLFLEAAHIVSWFDDESSRTNPCNGLCLTPFFHKAYENDLIGISPDYEIYVSEKFLENNFSPERNDFRTSVKNLHGKKLILPMRFLPDQDMLSLHFERFKK